MYCPKCSQQQVSDDMRFCSRCGFSLIAVKELIEGGSAPIEPGAAQADLLAAKLKGIRRGAWMLLVGLVLTVFVGMLSIADDDFAVLLFLPLLSIIIGFILVLHGVFLKGKRALKQPQPVMPAQLSTPPRSPELSAPRVATTSIESFTGQRVQTAEMVHPPSVTENTTRLLDEESDPRRR